MSKTILRAVLSLMFVTGLSVACSSSKVCTSDEVKVCDDNLNTCLAKSPCNDATQPTFQACVDACKKDHCSCLTACGSTCN